MGPSTKSSRPGLPPPRVQAEDIGLELYHPGLQGIVRGQPGEGEDSMGQGERARLTFPELLLYASAIRLLCIISHNAYNHPTKISLPHVKAEPNEVE